MVVDTLKRTDASAEGPATTITRGVPADYQVNQNVLFSGEYAVFTSSATAREFRNEDPPGSGNAGLGCCHQCLVFGTNLWLFKRYAALVRLDGCATVDVL